jgi:hypothetical protein
MATKKKMGAAGILNQFFNKGAGKKPLKEFNLELKELSPGEKNELAALAAVELGVEFNAPKTAS